MMNKENDVHAILPRNVIFIITQLLEGAFVPFDPSTMLERALTHPLFILLDLTPPCRCHSNQILRSSLSFTLRMQNIVFLRQPRFPRSYPQWNSENVLPFVTIDFPGKIPIFHLAQRPNIFTKTLNDDRRISNIKFIFEHVVFSSLQVHFIPTALNLSYG